MSCKLWGVSHGAETYQLQAMWCKRCRVSYVVRTKGSGCGVHDMACKLGYANYGVQAVWRKLYGVSYVVQAMSYKL
eukprot:2078643-Pyramimonas_sp.AAC.1